MIPANRECSNDLCPRYIAEEYVIQIGGVLHTNERCMSFKSLVYADIPREFHLQRAVLL